MAGGTFLVLEGIDGSGTTTQRDRLGDTLARAGYDVHPTAEPSKGEIGKAIRAVLKGERTLSEPALALLFAADRLDHVQREIEPALERGAIVVSDRYVLSSLAYQSIDLPLEWVGQINNLALVPDLTLFLRVAPEVAEARRKKRGGAAERFDAPALQRRIAEAYEESMQHPVAGEVVLLDGDADADAVAASIWRAVESRLPAPPTRRKRG